MIIIIFIIILVIILFDYIFLKKIFISNSIKNTIHNLSSKKKIKLPKTQGRGIVIPINGHADKAVLLINILKTYSIPITVTCNKDINGLGGVNKIVLNVSDDQLDIYSLINSPYQETILIQPNVLFIGNPEELFNNPIYNQTGLLFWRDPISAETASTRKICDTIKELVPYEIRDNPITNRSSTSFQAKGIIVFDKTNHVKTLQNLIILAEEHYIIKLLDKEIYWVAAELAQETYGFNYNFPGIIGAKNDITGMICGYNLYYTEASSFVWWEGSIFDVNDKVIEFSHYTNPGNGKNNYNNLAAVFSYGSCAGGFDIKEIDKELKNIINNYIYIFHNLRRQYPDLFL